MSPQRPNLAILARRIAESDPRDSVQQARWLGELEEALHHTDPATERIAHESLGGAVLLARFMTTLGHVGGKTILDLVASLVTTAASGTTPSARAPNSNIRVGSSRFAGADPAGMPHDLLLGRVMLKKGFILEEHVEQALKVKRTTGALFGEILVKMGAATFDQVDDALTHQETCRRLKAGTAAQRPERSNAPVPPRRLASPLPIDDDTSLAPARHPSTGFGSGSLRLVENAQLGGILLRQGIISNEQLQRGLQFHRASGARIGEALVSSHACCPTDIDYALRLQKGMRRSAS